MKDPYSQPLWCRTLGVDDFVIGMEQFGQRIQPLMKSRAKALAA